MSIKGLTELDNLLMNQILFVLKLLDMLFRKIVHHPEAHFSGGWCSVLFDGTAVKFFTEPLLRIQTDAALIFLLHEITLYRIRRLSTLYNRESL